MIKKKQKGFSLIEMLVVATIAALLAAAGLVSYTTANRKARNARRVADLEQIRAALELYRTEVGDYSSVLPSGNCDSLNDSSSCWTNMLNTLKNGGFITGEYIEDPRSDVQTYQLRRTGFTDCAAVKTYEICATKEPASPVEYYCVCNP